mmetsp:Transcript_17645/g.17611  ORF Transcript_17645/g.17611 Transcript_17645/m.17611 type:complete len:233 (+) Transcript_17645:1146-1844(+)|eukprot:CAMPEP_0202941218 /NCGR_PEP_ID=MMETSP1395-20130829/1347_1 /ASSEMBLY_ACC=CAM_ASM_000871 /TAXON_ID=5961 /ORGANISM="Blepharisma japonicum, Strain Stock R1072" /LENGTH=232 /DNA_ID=CAMNT_0049636249 /DNA_START=1082 /DNA_END=1780 /DNA_ORIENTATION=-
MQEKKKNRPKEQPAPTGLVKRKTVYLPQNISKQVEENKEEGEVGFSKPEFLEIIQKLSPGLASSAEVMFDQFDEDKSGYLDFRELTICLSILSKGNFEDKLRVCFGAYDADHSGYLQRPEVQSLLENLLRPYANELAKTDSQELKSMIDEVWNRMMRLVDKCNGVVSFNDFVYGIKADALLRSVFCENVGSDDQKEIGDLKRILSKNDNKMKKPRKEREEREGNMRCKCIII